MVVRICAWCKSLQWIFDRAPLPNPEAIEGSERSEPLLHGGSLCPVTKGCHISAKIGSLWGAPINVLSVRP